MALFRYEAMDKSGRVLRGAMEARDEAQVADKLGTMGYSVQAVFAPGATVPSAGTQKLTAVQQPAAPSAPRKGIGLMTAGSGVPVSIKSCVHVPVLARFFRHLATMVKSGMSLGQALNDMVPVVHDSRLRVVLTRMRESTQGGQNLSGLMAEYPNIFPVHTIASVWSGELAGRLEIVLEEVAQDLEQEASDSRFARIGWGLTKINWIFFIICYPITNLVSLLTPVLKACLDSTGQMSPGQVLRVLLSEYMRQSFWPTLIVCLAFWALWVAWGHVKRVPRVRYVLDRWLLYAPLWGKFHKVRAKARFFHVLDGLIEAGVSMDAAWDAASLTPRNSYIADQLRGARARLGTNAGISQLLAAAGIFEHEDVGLVQSGERAGTVPDVLRNLSLDYGDRIASMRTSGKATSTTIMTIFGLALSIYIMVMTFSSYGALAVKAGEMMGQ